MFFFKFPLCDLSAVTKNMDYNYTVSLLGANITLWQVSDFADIVFEVVCSGSLFWIPAV